MGNRLKEVGQPDRIKADILGCLSDTSHRFISLDRVWDVDQFLQHPLWKGNTILEGHRTILSFVMYASLSVVSQHAAPAVLRCGHLTLARTVCVLREAYRFLR
jgi:hypothetical protein